MHAAGTPVAPGYAFDAAGTPVSRPAMHSTPRARL
jgi:hypothetical protein